MVCPAQAIVMGEGFTIDPEKCTGCQKCLLTCPAMAIGSESEPSPNEKPNFVTSILDREFDYAIIGSGLGGLLAAASLARQGKKVIVLESLGFLGGRFTGFDYAGCRICSGALHMLPHGAKGPLGQILVSLDLDVRLSPVMAVRSFEFKGKTRISEGNENLFKSFSILEKADLARIMLGLKMHEKLSPETDFGAWIKSQTRSELIYRMFQKSINFILSLEPDEISYTEMRAILRNARYYGTPAVILGGCKELIQKLEQFILHNNGTILTAAQAKEILIQDGRISGLVYLDRRSGTVRTLQCQTVVSDIGLQPTADLVKSESPIIWAGDPASQSARGFRACFLSSQPLMEHNGVMFCLDSQTICAITQPSSADPALAPPGQHLIITYQLPKTNNIRNEATRALDDLVKIGGPGFQDGLQLLNAGYFGGNWPVNRAVQGLDLKNIMPLPGLFMVGDQFKPTGLLMAEGVAGSVSRALEEIRKFENRS
jgi:phytoene dehydrogenase-like protein